MTEDFPLFCSDHLVAGDSSDPFLPQLLHAINHATEIDIAVGFIQATGLRLLYDALLDALVSGTKVRVLTGDYLCVTDPEALRTLLLLRDYGAFPRIFESNGQSFHMKAYLFVRSVSGEMVSGRAFVGSSNISKSALIHGLEWNLRVDWKENPNRFTELRAKFDRVFFDPRTQELTNSWIDSYVARRSSSDFVLQPGTDEKLPPPTPNHIQQEALNLLAETRFQGNQRGLVVMATGTGKTWLAAFDSVAFAAERVLFVAHREEILKQAEDTFIRIRPEASVGNYTGTSKDTDADLLFASIQTIGRLGHLRKFSPEYFDYIVVDEFHHAAAITYQKLLAHFNPKFLLGLTATPDRTDQADILSLCDDNLVIQRDLFDSIRRRLLCPFRYFGIADSTVNYQEIPWRNGKFDPDRLENKLATTARANHVLKEWREKGQKRTLAFCASTRHSDFMAEYFNRNGVASRSVHSKSGVRRNEAMQMLRNGEIEVLFSVDLFNEGVDVPEIDTILMIRPTESKILFLQQLGRGLRIGAKAHLIVLDFIGNHISFFMKFEALFHLEKTNRAKRELLEKVNTSSLELPPGCYMNYDLQAIEFMRDLIKTRSDTQIDFYQSLKESLGRRPTLAEFYLAGGGIAALRREYGQWFKFLESQGDIGSAEVEVSDLYGAFLTELETSHMAKSYKMVLLEAMLDLDGFTRAPLIPELSRRSFQVMNRRLKCREDLPEEFRIPFENYQAVEKLWIRHWLNKPINAWTGGWTKNSQPFFEVADGRFVFKMNLTSDSEHMFEQMVMELVNFRYEQYNSRKEQSENQVSDTEAFPTNLVEIPYFTDLRIACGHFKTSSHEMEVAEYKSLPESYGKLNPARHFIARASGNSMDGGKSPIRNGDYLLLDLITPETAGSISNELVVVEKQDSSGDYQYLLRYIQKNAPGDYTLKAWNEDYPDISATENMFTRARVKRVIDPLDLILHSPVMRADIPGYFGIEFNNGVWQSGHVCLSTSHEQILLVTLNKQGHQEDHKYHDYFIDSKTFHWQSQNSTSPSSKRGRAIVEHRLHGSHIHLFVRKNKLIAGKGSPFTYCGIVNYLSHTGSEPMSVRFSLETPLSVEIAEDFGVKH